MAITPSTSFDRFHNKFEKQVLATLAAQSTAIAAALALAAKQSGRETELYDNKHSAGVAGVVPVQTEDKEHYIKHLGDIYREAANILKAQIELEKNR